MLKLSLPLSPQTGQIPSMSLATLPEKLVRLRLHLLAIGASLPPASRADYQVCTNLLDEILLAARAEPTGPGPLGLTPREGQILALLQHGHSNQQIAAQMGVTPGTVKTYLKSIYSKLNVQNRTQAALTFRPHLVHSVPTIG